MLKKPTENSMVEVSRRAAWENFRRLQEAERETQQEHLEDETILTKIPSQDDNILLIGEVTAIAKEHDFVVISLISSHYIQIGEQFQAIRPLTIPGGPLMNEVIATIRVTRIFGPDRSACQIINQDFPLSIHDKVQRIAQNTAF